MIDLSGDNEESINSIQLETVILETSKKHQLDQNKLRYWLKFFNRFHPAKQNLRQLQAMYALYNNENSQITIFGQLYGGKEATDLSFFDERVNFRSFIKMMVNLVKSKAQSFLANDDKPRYKGILPEDYNAEEGSDNFAVDSSQLQQERIKIKKREIYRGRKKLDNLTVNKGRIIRYSHEKKQPVPAIIPTLKAALKAKHYNLKNHTFDLQKSDFRYPEKQQQVRYNIMLVLDSSKSISWVIPHVEKFIPILTSRVTQSKDMLGLICFNNDMARIYHHPTRNVKQVIGTINELEVEGLTPLGKGIELALQTFQMQQFKQAGMKNMILLISDCFPEPIKGGYDDILDEPSYQLVIKNAKQVKDSKTGLLIINPAPITNKNKPNWGQKLAKKIVEITNCRYIEMPPSIRSVSPFKQEFYLKEAQLQNFHEAFSEIKFSL